MKDIPEIPHNTDAEMGMLGCVLDGAFDEAVKLGVSEESFHDIRLRGIWNVCAKLSDEGTDINPVNVGSKWREDLAFVASLPDYGPSAANVKRWWPDLWDAQVRRRAWMVHSQALREIASGATVDAVMASMEEALFKTSSQAALRDQKALKREFVELLEMASKGGLPNKGPRTGLDGIDDVYRGFRPASMNTLAARPGCGKTAFAVQVAVNNARQGKKVVVYSFEMSFNELFSRVVANESGEDLGWYFESGKGDITKIGATTMRCMQWPLIIEDNADTTLEGLRQSMRLHAKEGASLFIIDYLQLIRGGRRYDKRVDEVSAITRGLKRSFMETGVPGLVLAQMNRAIEGRNGKPQLSDLRESGSIEQDSDTVAFLHKDADDDWAGIEYIIRKNRHGSTGTKMLDWTKWCGRFSMAEQ